mmetsp:Transcript_21838/g.49681  ORF Transcript_21838/g.49681 Transcript_21838/m.49681 type:complete len:283 (-) Transcript_21838:278-1126(-)
MASSSLSAASSSSSCAGFAVGAEGIFSGLLTPAGISISFSSRSSSSSSLSSSSSSSSSTPTPSIGCAMAVDISCAISISSWISAMRSSTLSTSACFRTLAMAFAPCFMAWKVCIFWTFDSRDIIWVSSVIFDPFILSISPSYIFFRLRAKRAPYPVRFRQKRARRAEVSRPEGGETIAVCDLRKENSPFLSFLAIFAFACACISSIFLKRCSSRFSSVSRLSRRLTTVFVGSFAAAERDWDGVLFVVRFLPKKFIILAPSKKNNVNVRFRFDRTPDGSFLAI